MRLRTPLRQARGLGSAKDGTRHWWMTRLTAVAMAPLMLWLIFNLARLAEADYATTVAWAAAPWNTVLLILVIATLFYHARLGLQTIIEDYVHHEARKFALLILMQFAMVLLALGGIVAILQIALGGVA